jgi:hypothetical protein
MKSEDFSIFQRFLIRFPAHFAPVLFIYLDKLDGCKEVSHFPSRGPKHLGYFSGRVADAELFIPISQRVFKGTVSPKMRSI